MKKTILEKLLDYYHISHEEYLHLTRPVTLDDLPSPFNFKRMDEAIKLVKSHVEQGHKIVIYGDYDADGITGTSILVKMFMYIGFNANYYIPSRYLDGYGINEIKAKEIIDKKYDLVITVDNGIAAIAPIKMLKEAGIDVLVIDHHDSQDVLPEANVIIHPIISEFSKVTSSGAFTAFMFASAYLGYFDKYLSTLAAISLISDMMPLIDYNRDLLRAVISDYKYGEFPNIDYLLENEVFDDVSIGMGVAPKINAVGRIDTSINVNRLVKYFTITDHDLILSYKKWILECNELRKNKSKDAKENIIANIKDCHEEALIIEVDLEEGLLGLVANSLMNQLNIPVIVLTADDLDKDVLRGSARSIEGFSLSDSFLKLSHLLLTFGGHALAAGITLRRENLEEFKKEFIEIVKNTNIVKKPKDAVELYLTDINEETYKLVKTFSPFGEEWRQPLFKLRHIKVKELMYSKNRMNIITSISLYSRIVGFNYSQEMMKEYDFIDLIGTLKVNDYNGRRYIEFHIQDIKES